MSGLAPPNLRVTQPPAAALAGEGVSVDVGNDNEGLDVDPSGAVLKIEHGDGSVTISLNGKSLIEDPGKEPSGWWDNLVDEVDDMELGRVAQDLLRGIDDDLDSRKDWIEDRALGVKLLGLKIEVPGLQGASDGAPVEGMSKVRHSLLLEAVLRFQANARSEMLPTDGPIKIRDDSTGGPQSETGDTVQEDRLADALEMDLNHYLTAVATEYYPDTDRMFLMLGFGGTSFKKVYYCPLRSRPVSETVDAPDLIVSNAATDLRNARRVTHRTMMRPSVVKRLQILKVYRDIDLHTPLAQKLDSLQREEKSQQGISPDTTNPEDRDREIYECYCELDLKGFEHKVKGKETGLEIPYRVTIDVSSQNILSIVRNYDEKTKDLPEARTRFVKYTFVPGFGFYDIGLLNILGNTTNALTAAWREMLDNGMYANFPGFLVAKSAGRQNTNIFRVPPGGGAQVDTGGGKIQDAIMPLPYQTSGMAPLMALVGSMEQGGQRLGGTSEQQVGEGRADAPVGTTLAMIEQATKILNAVHKRMHAAQAEEFKMLVEVFREHPESFWAHDCPSKTKWAEVTFLAALNDCDIVPQADPNTASHGQRVMKIMALKQLQAQSPAMYNPVAIDTAALQAIGWNNPQQFFAPPAAQAAPPPELLEIQAKMKTEQQIADAKVMDANARAEVAHAKTAEVQAKAAQGGFAAKPGLNGADKSNEPSSLDQANAQARLMDAQTKKDDLGIKQAQIESESHNQALDRQAEAHSDLIDLAKEVMTNPARAKGGAKDVKPIEREIGS